MAKKKHNKPSKISGQYFAGFSVLILITNSVICILDYLKIEPSLMATAGLYANIIFILSAIVLYFYVRKITLKNETAFAKINQTNNTYSDQWMVDNISQILCIKDDQGRWLVASKSFLKMLNVDPDNYQGKTDNELCAQSPQFKQVLLSNYRHDESAWEKREPVSRMTDLPGKTDNVTIKLTKTPIYDAQGDRFKLITSGSDITMGDQQQNSLILAASVFQQSMKCLFILDLQLKVLQINSALSNLIGFSNNKVKGQSLSFFNEQEIDETLIQDIRNQIQFQQFWEGEFFCVRKGGALFPAQMNIASVKSRSKGNIKHYIGFLSEITEPSTPEQAVAQQAHFDKLTNLPNRNMFIEQLDHELSHAQYQNSRTVLLFINLDKFKSVNIQRGLNVGDSLLMEVAKRLSESIRSDDLAARLGGDEFGVLVKNINSYGNAHETASVIAEKILALLAEAFNIEDQELSITASIGIAIYPEDASNGQSLLKHADISMNSAKEQGRNNYQFFEKEHITNLKSRYQLEADIHKALDRQEFKVFYQPRFGLKNNNMIGAEALVRWTKNDKTVVPPGAFIPIAEENGLIIPLGKWILETACQQQKVWLDTGYALNRISVNISRHQLFEQQFIETLQQTLAKTELNPENLELEITEPMLIGDMDKVIEQLQRIAAMGISLAIDNFGTGYSSLAYLKDFPIHRLKIDHCFVKNIPTSTKEMNIVRAIIEMGHSLGLTVVADGVETAEQFEFLKDNGCDYMQGYLFSKPIDAEAMTPLLKSAVISPEALRPWQHRES